MKIAVVEAGAIGGGATAAGMGHIVVMDDSPAQLALTRYSQGLWNQLAGELPADVEWMRCGTLWVAADEEELAEVHHKRSLYAGVGLRAEVLSGADLLQAEPKLRKGLAGGLLVSDDSVIYAPCAARFLLERAQAEVVRGRAIAATE